MYIIGIDFGYSETTASCINTNDSVRRLTWLHILDGDTAESNKVESAVCRDVDTGEWRFIKDFRDYSNPGFTTHFKAPMDEISTANNEAFAAFIKLVYEHILSNNDFLTKEPFCIYAAYPAGWSDQIFENKEFLSKYIPIEWVIKESDAIYYKFKIERIIQKPLIIDIGSSTIDFMLYESNGIMCFNEGYKHGDSRVEIEICNYFRNNDPNFKEAEEEASTTCEKNGINWFNVVLHYVKNQKEYFYTNVLLNICLDLSNRRIDSTLKKRVFDGVVIDNKLLEDTILKNYKTILKHDMEHVKGIIGNPEAVVLTGSASRMSWLQNLVNDVFSDSEIHRDNEPSYVVSDGIAWYGLKSFESRPCIEQTLNNLLNNSDATIVNEIWSKTYNRH